MPSLAISA
ncbi:unnamed protein product [Linum tenue]|uniref:Uncharacterized protein n=1 Tax=Linum tenue TaxID=586396 RepID=A0AAV0IUY7_9ROSI|nr:unnamed protein product [Linum tenue]